MPTTRKPGVWTYSTLSQGRFDEPVRLLNIHKFDLFTPSHPGVCLTQSNHTFQLSSRRCDSLFLGPGIDTCFTHLDVGCDQGVGGCLGEDWVDLGS